MAQQVEAFAGKPSDLSQVSQTHMVARTNSQKFSSGLHTCTTAMHPHTTQAQLNVPKLVITCSHFSFSQILKGLYFHQATIKVILYLDN